ncbi:unnamed protein product [Orchesella dallaii]|uniref:RING-type E3 ubiquitin transferase n=1 Tax=Orchesella dallaii TaxID=48710 RepID=A0ABP1QGK5_9HEXA
MENFKTCPICFQVPEENIYQCFAGHIICHLCILKVHEGLCPQCRIPYGSTKIRSLILEQILDTQQFNCKFKNFGCERILLRKEVTKHGKFCFYNPNLVPLCELMGYKKCNFLLGLVSRAEIIAHFENAHNCSFKCVPKWVLVIPGSVLMEPLSRKRKATSSPGGPTGTIYNILHALVSPDQTETGPLFLVYGKVDKSAGLISLLCIQIWGPESCPYPSVMMYKAEMTLTRDMASLPSTSSAPNPILNNVINPFPITWKLLAYRIKEAVSILKSIPVNVSIRLLEESRFGVSIGDSLLVRITRA